MNIKQDILDWIKTFVEVSHPLWGDLPPCPYARAAKVNNEIDIVVQDDVEYYQFIKENIESFKETDLEVRLIVAKEKMDPVEYTDFIKEQNRQIIQCGLYILSDHPDIIEMNGPINVQQGTYVITYIQRIENLKKASENLHKTAYYDNWDKEVYKRIVLDRQELWDKYKNGPV